MHVARVLEASKRAFGQVRRHGLRLRDLLRLEALAFQHVLEVHVATDVQLVRAVQADTAVFEELRHHAVRDGGAHLGLDVVANDRDACVLELLGPRGVRGDEDRQGVDERDLGVEGALGVELVCLVRSNGEVGDEHVGLRVLEDLHDVNGGFVGLGDGLLVVLTKAVERYATHDLDVRLGDVADLDRVVLGCLGRLDEFLTYLERVHVKRGHDLDVRDVVVAKLDVHEAGNGFPRLGVLVVLDALNEGRRAVSNADDGETQLSHISLSPCLARGCGVVLAA